MRLGAQATIEMQKEARRIQEENRLLRTLLHDQGFDDVAIQRVIDAAKLAEGNTNQMQVSCLHSFFMHVTLNQIDTNDYNKI